MDVDLARAIQRQMERNGFHAAAEQFMDRARFYSERELSRLGRIWCG